MSKNVQTAKAQKPDPSKTVKGTSTTEDGPKTVVNVEPEASPTALPFDVSKIDPQKVKMAEELGIPVGQILVWASSVEARLAVMEKEMPEKVVNVLKALAEKRQAQIEEQARQNPQPKTSGDVGLGDVMKVIGAVAGSAPQENSMSQKFMDAMMDKAMMGMDLSNALSKAVVLKIAPELADSLIPSLKPTEKKTT